MKMVSAQEAVAAIKDGSVIMIGGFMSNGTPEILIDALIEKNVKDLTIIANDSGTPGTGIARLLEANLVKKMIASHIGLNPMAGQMMHDGIIEMQLVPQGTLVEQIRAGGAGLGGVLTPTGLGTEVAAGKEVLEIDGKQYLLEKPLKADFALIRGSVADEKGNVYYKATTRNFNPVMATAAETVIVAAEEIVPVGELQPELIATPGIFVDYLVGGEPHVG
ncbi:CoA transferase subunit A [Konateibacter massiliensis]|uniref:CoA transferase subunit A n=1 Tax=Konateibacter massiliensis TaxID=2002841 RepID=UPI000C1520F9|nr:CoA transferase subunit A [Konateibacter massiliensis]